MVDFFKEVTYPYNLTNSLICGFYKIKTVRYGSETITYLGPKIWSTATDEIKESPSSVKKMKLRKPDTCETLFNSNF